MFQLENLIVQRCLQVFLCQPFMSSNLFSPLFFSPSPFLYVIYINIPVLNSCLERSLKLKNTRNISYILCKSCFSHTALSLIFIFSPASFSTNTFRKSNISERHFAVGLNVLQKKKGAKISNIANSLMQWPILGKSKAVI